MTPDPFEAELQALRPRPPSPDLRRQVAGRLAPAPRWPGRAALVGGLVAAGVVLALLLDRGGRHDSVVVVPPRPAGGAATHTLQEYRVALAKSPAALDALLDTEARRPAAAGPPARSVGAFAAIDADLLTWKGTH
jgi:hypothetical protein